MLLGVGVGVERKRKEGEELQSDFTSRSHSLAQIHDAGTCMSFSLFLCNFFFLWKVFYNLNKRCLLVLKFKTLYFVIKGLEFSLFFNCFNDSFFY